MQKSYFYHHLGARALCIALVACVFALWSGMLQVTPVAHASHASTAAGGEPQKLSVEELVSVVKPSVVRIVAHIEIEATIPSFKINFKDFKVTTTPGAKPLVFPRVSLDIAGSGFVVNPDGYILTNSHVVSDTTAKAKVLAPFIENELAKAILSLSPADAKKIDTEKTLEDGVAFGRQILDYVMKESTFILTKKIVVLDPSSSGQTLEKLLGTGFPAEIVSINENWHNDNRDIAILKIAEKNLPSLRLGSSDKLSVGQQVHIFGFPTNAELGGNNLLESTFTKGVVSAIKNSPKNEFKIFQTDAKISTGSSGGPLFEDDGQVAGLVTLETSMSAQQNGDNFAFAIPAEIAKNAISDNFIINDEGIYGPHMKAGILLARDKHCKKALEEYALAKSVNGRFAVAKYVDSYIEKCDTLIASGLSIDSKWDEIALKLRSMGMIVWAIFAAIIFLLIALGLGITVLIKRLKKDKTELEHLEQVVEHNVPQYSPAAAEIMSGAGGGSVPVEVMVRHVQDIQEPLTESNSTQEQKDVLAGTPLGAAETEPASLKLPGEPMPPNQVLIDYIRRARAAGFTFQTIEHELKNVGWSDDEVARALATPQQ